MTTKSSNGRFYITTPIYYVNDLPHIGHAYTTIAADVLARYHRWRGDKVFFLVGTDENAQKNVEAALRWHKPPLNLPLQKGEKEGVRRIVQQYVNEMSTTWQKTWKALDISNDDFIRTTEPRHVKYVEKFWGLVKKGDIYKGKYEGLYCTGCESYKTESDLMNGLCTDHQRKPEKLSEENYFFKLSDYRKKLLDHIKKHPEFIQPVSRRNEMIVYIRDHAQDFSISRKNLQWGIPVPEDPTQTIYVWFDALLNYISAVAPSPSSSPTRGEEKIENSPPLVGGVRGGGTNWWPADLHLVGKDIIKFHCAYWPAMLMSAGLPLPRTVFAHGFFTVNGQKMSKTIGNVVDPVALAQKYGNDVLRYYLLREIRFGEDGDFSEARLRERYNGELANGLGNLVARVLTMVEKYRSDKKSLALSDATKLSFDSVHRQYKSHMANFALDRALDTVWDLIRQLDVLIDKEQPWVLAKKDDKKRLNMVLSELVGGLEQIAQMLQPFMPETTQKITTQLKQGKKGKSLFPRLP